MRAPLPVMPSPFVVGQRVVVSQDMDFEVRRCRGWRNSGGGVRQSGTS